MLAVYEEQRANFNMKNIKIKKAQVAQLVERNFEGVQVISSNLILGIGK